MSRHAVWSMLSGACCLGHAVWGMLPECEAAEWRHDKTILCAKLSGCASHNSLCSPEEASKISYGVLCHVSASAWA